MCPCHARTFLFSVLSLSLSTVAERDSSHSDALSVDTRGHFQKRAKEEAKELATSSDVIERLAHSIAKDLAHELKDSRHHDLTILKVAGQAVSQQDIDPPPPPPSDAQPSPAKSRPTPAGLLEKHTKSRSSKSSGSSHSQRIFDNLESLSHDLDSVSDMEKSADSSASSAVSLVKPKNESSSMESNSLRDFAKIFQPAGSLFQQKAALWPPKPVLAPLKATAKTGLDGVAGNLLQLKESVVKRRHTLQMRDVPDFDTLDPDHKGSLNLEQFKSFTSKSDTEVEKLFNSIDKNGAGKVDKEEFNQAKKEGKFDDGQYFDVITQQGSQNACISSFRPHALALLVASLLLLTRF